MFAWSVFHRPINRCELCIFALAISSGSCRALDLHFCLSASDCHAGLLWRMLRRVLQRVLLFLKETRCHYRNAEPELGMGESIVDTTR